MREKALREHVSGLSFETCAKLSDDQTVVGAMSLESHIGPVDIPYMMGYFSLADVLENGVRSLVPENPPQAWADSAQERSELLIKRIWRRSSGG